MKRSIKFLAPTVLVLMAANFRAAFAVPLDTPNKIQLLTDRSDAGTLLASPFAQPPLFTASTDSKHQNEDFILLKPGETRKIPLPAGVLVRLWSTALEPDKIDLRLQKAESGPLPGPPFDLLRSGKAKEGSYENKTFLWYPVADGKSYAAEGWVSLVVVNKSQQPNKWFYQATIRPTGLKTAALPKTDDIVHGQPKLSVDAKGPALVTSLTLRFSVKPDEAVLRKARLIVSLQPKATGTPTEVVDVPLGPLVGSFKADAGPLHDAMTDWDGQKLTLHWPMPFDGARQMLAVEVTGGSAAIEADVATLPQSNPYRFHAAYGSERTVKKQPIPILKVTGEGAFVGLRMAAAPAPDSARRAFAYLEGNETLKADGKTYEGTGTEDFFNSAWYFPDKPFALPYGGLTERTALPPAVSMYRLMIPDALPFKRDFKFDFEVGRNNNADDLEYRWVAFWYQKESGTVAIGDALKGGTGDTSANALNSMHNPLAPNGVKSLPDMPRGVEIAIGLVLLAAVGLSLSAVFRKKKR